MNSGDNYSEFNDKRLAYIYNELTKRFKFKHDSWVNMMKTADNNVCIFTIIMHL